MTTTTKAKRVAPKVNPHRGEASWNGFKLCLTMNALVEIEQGLGTKLSKMGAALADPSVEQIRLVLSALVRGGGATVDGRPMTDEEVGAHMLNIHEATQAIEQAFKAAGVFAPDEPGKAPGK